MKIKGALCTILSAFLYGFTPILASLTYEMGNNSLSMTFYRNLFAIPFLYVLLKYNKLDLKIEKQDLKYIIMVSVFGITATTALLYSSYSYIGVGAATTLHFMYPVFVAVLCRYAFGENLSRQKIIALCLACVGVFCFMDFQHIENILGVVMAVTSALTYAFYMTMVEKSGLVKISPYKLSFYIAIFAALTMLIGNIFIGYIVVNLPLKAFVFMIIVAFFTSFLAMILMQVGIREIGSTSAAIFSLFEPITSVITGVLILNEAVSITEVIGCIVIFFSISYLAVSGKE